MEECPVDIAMIIIIKELLLSALRISTSKSFQFIERFEKMLLILLVKEY